MKTVNFFLTEKTSNRVVYVYSILLSLACLLITLSPVFGQVEDDMNQDKPIVKVKVEKEYDENGNVVRIDSVYTYYFSDKFVDNESDTLAFNDFNPDQDLHNLLFDFPNGHFDFPNMPDPLIPDFHFDFYCDSSISFNRDYEKYLDDANMEKFFAPGSLSMDEIMKQQHDMMKQIEDMLKQQQEMIKQYMDEEMNRLKENSKDLKKIKKEKSRQESYDI